MNFVKKLNTSLITGLERDQHTLILGNNEDPEIGCTNQIVCNMLTFDDGLRCLEKAQQENKCSYRIIKNKIVIA